MYILKYNHPGFSSISIISVTLVCMIDCIKIALMGSILVSAAIKNTIDWVVLTSEINFLIVLEDRSPQWGCQCGQVLVRYLFGLQMALLSYCLQMVERE